MQKNLLKSIIKELNLDKDVYKSNIVYSRISQLKNSLISPAGYESNAEIRMDDTKRKTHRNESCLPKLPKTPIQFWVDGF